MKEFLQALNEYPWTSLFVFIGLLVILVTIAGIITEGRK